jgi:hypothetical protein
MFLTVWGEADDLAAWTFSSHFLPSSIDQICVKMIGSAQCEVYVQDFGKCIIWAWLIFCLYFKV